MLEYWLADPQRAFELQSRLGKSYLDLWAATAKRMAGEPTPPVVEPDPRDKRFADPEWTSNQFFDFLKQAYLLTTDWANHLVSDADGLDPHMRHKAEFYVRQIANAIVAVEFRAHQSGAAARDPGVERRKSRARHADAGRGHRGRRRHLKIRQSDVLAFRGRPQSRAHARQGDLPERADAAHPICAVDAKTSSSVPLLIVPPWINKFYMLDLTPDKSFIKWCVDQGLTVFCISWVNPGRAPRRKGFDDYMREGPLAGARRDREGDRREQVHAIGYCVGGTLLAVTLAYLAAKGRRPRQVRDVLHRAGRFHLCRRSQGFRRRRGADRHGRTADGASAAISKARKWRRRSTCCARTT